MRPVVTEATIRDAIAAGITELPLQPGAIVTSLAREFAQRNNVRLIPSTEQRLPEAPPSQAPMSDRAALRAAVIKALGKLPEGLDEALDKVLGGK